MKRFLSSLLASFKKSPKPSGSLPHKRQARLGVECLEGRVLMTAGLAPVAAPPYTTTLHPPQPAPPAASDGTPGITNFSAKAVSGTQINLAWSSGSEAADVCELINGKWMEIATTNTEGYSVTGLQPGTTYEFKVGDSSVFTQNGTLDYTNTATATTTTILNPPPLSAKAVSPSQVNLTWAAVSGATGYVVERLEGSTWTPLATVSGTSYSATGLFAASTNSFRVAAVNEDQMSGYSMVSALTWPAAPSNVVAKTVSTSQINLTWSAVGGTTGYAVYFKAPSGALTLYEKLPVGQTSVSVTGLSAGTTYNFEVAATNTAGTTYSSPVSATTQVGVLAAPSNFAVQAVSTTEAVLTWNAVAGATSYVVDYYTSSGWKEIPGGSTGSNYMYLNLTPGATYAFDVVAVNAAGNYGAWATYKIFTMP